MGKKAEESKKPGVMIYFEILPVLENLWWWQRFSVLEAIIYYARDRKLPKFRGPLKAVWALVQPIVDRDDSRYYKNLEAKKKAGKARGEQITREAKARKEKSEAKAAADEQLLPGADSQLQQEGSESIQSPISNPQSPISNPQTTILNPQSSVSNIEPPTVQQVRAYCQREGLETNAEDFVEYYGSMGWRLSGGPIRDWQALARRWHRKALEKRKEAPQYGNFGVVL